MAKGLKTFSARWFRRSYLKKAMVGYLFISPFLLGLVFLFIGLLVQTFQFSRSRMAVTPDGFVLHPVGWDNFNHIFFVDAEIRIELFSSIVSMGPQVLVIIIFSFFAANLINQKFRGRSVARAILFLPIILTSGVILALEAHDVMLNYLGDVSAQAQSLDGETLRLLRSVYTILGPMSFTIGGRTFSLMMWVVTALQGIYDIIIASGVQILIFLAGLQSIPPSLYEASTVEGASRWENFWLITFPMVSPLILVNTVYSVIDSFTNPLNEVMIRIHELAFVSVEFGRSAALSMSYFLIVLLLLAIVVGVISRMVFYYD